MADNDEVFVPEQVRRQAARAEELQRELAAGRAASMGDEPPGAEAVPPEAGTTGSEPPPAPSGASPAPAAEPPAAPPHPGPGRPPTDWEQRYRTLQGKYDTEIAGFRAQVSGLERLIATMQHQPPQPVAPPAPVPPAGPMEFEQGDIDIYGKDFLEAAARAAAARYEPTIARLNEKISRLEGGQQNLHSQNIQDRVFEQLDRDPELDGWRDLNTNPAFLQWLQGVDDYSGLSRNVMLQHAYSHGDAIRTGRFFKKYMAEHTDAPRPSAAPQTDYVPRPPARPHGSGNGYAAPAGGSRLEEMVVPGRAAGPGGSGNGAPQPRIWSRPEITRFYRDRTEGKFRGREGESDALERDILAAAQEGRIQ